MRAILKVAALALLVATSGSMRAADGHREPSPEAPSLEALDPEAVAELYEFLRTQAEVAALPRWPERQPGRALGPQPAPSRGVESLSCPAARGGDRCRRAREVAALGACLRPEDCPAVHAWRELMGPPGVEKADASRDERNGKTAIEEPTEGVAAELESRENE